MAKPVNPIEKQFSSITRYHYLCYSLIFLSKTPTSWHLLNLIFLSPPMSYQCMHSDSSNGTTPQGAGHLQGLKLDVYECPCSYVWWNRTVFTETMHTKFSLFCEREWLASFSHSMNYVGVLAGSLSTGFVADRYGRLPILSLCYLLTGVAGALVSAMPTAGSFIFLRCLEGIGVGGCLVVSFVLAIEYTGTKYREIVTALFHIPINIGTITLAGISYLLRHMDYFQLAISIPMLLFGGLYFVLQESPKWLIDYGHRDKAAIALEKICRFNNQESTQIREELDAYLANRPQDKQKITFWQIFKSKKMARNFLCMAFIFFVCGLGFYGVSQYIGQMSGDIHLNVVISGATLMVGTIATIFLFKVLGRRSLFLITSLCSGVFMLVVVAVPEEHSWVRIAFASLCNCFFFMSFIDIFLYAVELFPTRIRSTVLGTLAVLSRVGQIIAPPINDLSQVASGTFYGVMALLSTVVCYPLPDTKDIELPSSIEELKSLKRKRSSQVDDGGNQGTSSAT